MAALLTSDQNNMDRVTIEVAECERMGIEVLPPDINESFAGFSVVPKTNKIRFGLSAIKNVGEAPIEAIVQERKRKGPYKSIEDFIKRVDFSTINKKVLESLIRSGALDNLEDRGKLLTNMESFLDYGVKKQRSSENGQIDMLSLFKEEETTGHLDLKEGISIDKKQKMAWEKELLGMYISEHPLKEFSKILKNKTTSINSLTKEHLDRKVIVGGVITGIKKVLTRKKEQMMFASLEDITGNLEVLVFPKILEAYQGLWLEDKIILVQGRVSENRDGELKIIAEKARELTQDDLKERALKVITLEIKNGEEKETFSKIKEVLEENKGDDEVILLIKHDGQTKKIKLPFRVNLDQKTQDKLKKQIDAPIEVVSV